MDKNNKKKIIIYSSVACLAIMGTVTVSLLVNKPKMLADTNDKSNLTSVEIAEENIQKTDLSKTFYIKSEYSLDEEPTIENLYKNADIVLIGTFDSDIKTYTNGVNINTKTEFKTSEVVKNNSKFNVSDNVVVDRIGGTMKLSDYMENNITIRNDEFTDIPVNDRDKYYVVQEFAPNDNLNFASIKNNDSMSNYIIFLNYIEEEDKLMLNSAYYGMREIKDNKVYNYDTKQFIEINNNNISKAIQNIK